MLELGKVEERRGIDMNSYLLRCKAETGLSLDRLPQGLREFTPVEIRSSVVEAGRYDRGDTVVLPIDWETIRFI